MKIKAVFMDMDGTLLRSDHTISEKLKNKLQELENKGIKIFISTGRPFASTKPYVEMLEIKNPVIVFIGGMVVNPATEEVVFEDSISADDVQKLIEISHEKGIHLNLYSNGKLYFERETEEGLAYATKTGLEYVCKDFDIFKGKKSTKGLYLASNEILVELKEELEQRVPDLDYMFSQPTYLECLNKGVNKGRAVKAMIDKYGFTEDEVMAFGDQWNDLQMLKLVKYGYLMGNATDELKKEFPENRITLSNDEDGIYEIIKEL